jgi:hypothetical protein
VFLKLHLRNKKVRVYVCACAGVFLKLHLLNKEVCVWWAGWGLRRVFEI